MKRIVPNRQGFILFLAFVVTTVLFFISLGAQDIARTSLDLSRSSVLETITFHAADGGLERGLARIRKKFSPFMFSYTTNLGPGRIVSVTVEGVAAGGNLNLKAKAGVEENRKIVAITCLERTGVENLPGRLATGRFREAQ